MNNTPITDKAWDEMPHYVMSFGRAIRMREACREMERQRNELLDALEGVMTDVNFDWDIARFAIAKAKGESHE